MTTANDNIRGAVIMMASMAAFTFNDVIFKTVSGELPLFQAIFLRGVIVTVGFFVFMVVSRQRLPRIGGKDWKLIAARTLGDLGATVTFLLALFNAPIADVTAILQAAPLVLTLAGAVFLGEKVGWRRYSAIGAGLFGVFLIVRPGGEGFNPFVLYAVAALGFVLLRDLPTRRLSASVPSLYVAFLTALAITVCSGLASLTEVWAPVTFSLTVRLSGAAFFLFGAYIFAVMVMRIGDMGFVQPFRFTGILWAILLGYLVFDEYPDALALIGTAIVIAMGVYTFYRESKVKT